MPPGPPDDDSNTTLSDIAALLAPWLEGLSLGRAQIVVDQIRASASGRTPNRQLVVVSAGHAVERGSGEDVSRDDACRAPAALAIATVQRSTDTATLLHVGWTDPVRRECEVAECAGSQAPGRLAKRLHQRLRRHGVRFLQWATDPLREPGDSADQTRRWAKRIGLEHMGELEYLSKDFGLSDVRRATAGNEAANQQPDAGARGIEPRESVSVPREPALITDRLWLSPIQPDLGDEGLLRGVVETSYRGTLDCPGLTRHRNAAQMLETYRASPAYCPSWWYLVFRRGGTDDAAAVDAEASTRLSGKHPIGCVMLAAHGASPEPSGGDAGISEAKGSGLTAELVYMGLVPEARGSGLGGEMMVAARHLAAEAGASRMILAVDAANHPARGIYEADGFSSVLRESVFAMSLGGG